MLFDGYELKDYIVKALKDLKFESFTTVQHEVFDNLNNNKNIIAKSKTGSGKTHSFLVPIFNDLDEDDYKVQALIVAPTLTFLNSITFSLTLFFFNSYIPSLIVHLYPNLSKA